MSQKGGTVCIVRSCSSRTGETTSLFRIPKDPVRAGCWLRLCNREDLLYTSIDALHRNYRVCEKHFDSEFIARGGTRNHLFGHAVPSIFPQTNKHPLEVIDDDNFNGAHNKVAVLDDTTSGIVLKEETIDSPQAAINISDTTSGIVLKEETIDSPQAAINISDPGQSLDVIPCRAPSSRCMFSPPTLIQTPAYLSSGTPRKSMLYEKLTDMRRKKCMETSYQQTDPTLEDFNEMCDNFLSEPLSGIVKAQAKLKKLKPSARRYSTEYKQFALTLYFLGPGAYHFISKLFCLPTKRCLEHLTQKLTFKPGFRNEAVFKSLEIKSRTMLDQDKHCVICIDEISLKSNLYYHTGRDEIVGLHDTGNGEKKMLLAQNACIIMVRGLYNNWKQQIAYFFVNTQFNATELRSMIDECISKLFKAGFYVDALISNMGSNFIQLSNILGVTPSNPEFQVGDKNIIYLFDTCHLIKATRNNLMQNVFCFDGKKTSWSFIDMFFQNDKKQTYRCAPKLASSHICPTNFEKMKVKLATQVLSNTVASGMNTYVSLGALPTDAMATIEVIEKFDKLFDLLNSSDLNHPNKFENVFDGSDYQIQYLAEMRDFINELGIQNKDGNDVPSKSKFKNCWIVTINGILRLWEKLGEADFKYLKTRRVNQDAIENFFDTLRQQGGNCVNPTPIQFERAFRKLFCQNFLHTTNMNCSDNFDELLMKLKSNDILFTNEISVALEDEKSITLPDYDYRQEPMPMQNAFNYVCGYLIRKSLIIHSCEVCRKHSVEANTLDYDELLTHFKAFDNERSVYGGLRSPSKDFIHFIYQLEKIFISKFDDFCRGNRISLSYLEEMTKISYTHPCSQFPLLYVIKLFIRLKIFYTLKFSNEEMKNNKDKKNRKFSILSHL